MVLISRKDVLLQQVQRVFILGLVCGGFGACALAASVYDVGDWLDMW